MVSPAIGPCLIDISLPDELAFYPVTQAQLQALWLEYRIAKQCGSLMGDFEKEAAEQVKYQDKEYTPRTHPIDTDIIPIGRAKWVEAVDIPDWFIKEVSYRQYDVTPETELDKPEPTQKEQSAQLLLAYLKEFENDIRYKFWAAGRRRPKKAKAK